MYSTSHNSFRGCFNPDLCHNTVESEIINNWIRTSGAFDAVIYFDKCLADPNDPKNMLPIYDSGDHLHPGDMGYVHMGDCIDLSLFK